MDLNVGLLGNLWASKTSGSVLKFSILGSILGSSAYRSPQYDLLIFLRNDEFLLGAQGLGRGSKPRHH